jgi:hypothetical protein
MAHLLRANGQLITQRDHLRRCGPPTIVCTLANIPGPDSGAGVFKNAEGDWNLTGLDKGQQSASYQASASLYFPYGYYYVSGTLSAYFLHTTDFTGWEASVFFPVQGWQYSTSPYILSAYFRLEGSITDPRGAYGQTGYTIYVGPNYWSSDVQLSIAYPANLQ